MSVCRHELGRGGFNSENKVDTHKTNTTMHSIQKKNHL